MKHVYKNVNEDLVRQKHEHWGLLPTFDLDSSANIVAWNKLRLFLQVYEQRSSRRLQVSVVYLFFAWITVCVYQATKAWERIGNEVLDIETIFVISTTLMLAVGISSILFTVSVHESLSVLVIPCSLSLTANVARENGSTTSRRLDFLTSCASNRRSCWTRLATT